MTKIVGNAAVFVISYIIFMLPTYFLPFYGSNSIFVYAVAKTADQSHDVIGAFAIHVSILVMLAFLAFMRGTRIGHKWLIIFPILAIIFEFTPLLSLIPLLVTLLHLLCIVLGVALRPATPATS